MLPKLGILAGGGELPARLVTACRAAGREFIVIAFEGQADCGALAAAAPVWVRLGAAGKVCDLLHAAGVEELVFAGTIRRPGLAALRPDLRAARFFAKVGGRMLGDDGLMKAIIEAFEREEGFRVVAADSILADLLAGPGALSSARPDAEDEADIALGVMVARQLGALDVGQAVVVQQGVVLGVEAVEGTDALIQRCGALRRSGRGGVLVKVKKPQQEQRADPPTIGVATVRQAAAAGLRGIAVQTGGTLIIDRGDVARAADESGLFVVGVEVTG